MAAKPPVKMNVKESFLAATASAKTPTKAPAKSKPPKEDDKEIIPTPLELAEFLAKFATGEPQRKVLENLAKAIADGNLTKSDYKRTKANLQYLWDNLTYPTLPLIRELRDFFKDYGKPKPQQFTQSKEKPNGR